MHGPFFGGGWIWMPMMAFFSLIFFVGFLLLVVWIVRQFQPTRTVSHETPLDILKRRYASGEITKEEYERMKQDLA